MKKGNNVAIKTQIQMWSHSVPVKRVKFLRGTYTAVSARGG